MPASLERCQYRDSAIVEVRETHGDHIIEQQFATGALLEQAARKILISRCQPKQVNLAYTRCRGSTSNRHSSDKKRNRDNERAGLTSVK